jgi:hypothetical protein
MGDDCGTCTKTAMKGTTHFHSRGGSVMSSFKEELIFELSFENRTGF